MHLVTKNMWHSCGKFSLQDLFSRSDLRVRKIFRKFEKMVRGCGRVEMIPQKTRVVFMARMRFAAASPRRSHLRCAFILRRKIDNSRFQRVERFGPRCYGYHLAIRSEADLGNQIARWLKEAYEVGQQKHLT